MFIEGIVGLLNSDPGVKASLGAGGIWANIAPDSPVIPYVVYTQVSRQANIVYGGVNPTTELRFQFACYGNPYIAVKKLANAVKAVLDGFQGQLADPDNTYVGQTIPVSEHDQVESAFKATIYGVILDYHFIVYSPK